VKPRASAILGVAALALAVGGCAGGDSGEVGGETLTVYVSSPLHGARTAEGRAIVNGAKLALDEAGGRVGPLRVRAVYLDDTEGGRWSLARSAGNARRAAQDVTAIGYLGDLDSGATRASLPITNQAEMVQISPGSTAVDLTRLPPVGGADPDRYRPSGKQTFARVVPADDVQARAAALWAMRLGLTRIEAISGGSDFGQIMVDEFTAAAHRLGMKVVRARGGQGLRPSLGSAAGGIDGAYYGGTSGPATAAFRASAAARPDLQVLGSDALLDPAFLRAAAQVANRLHLTSPFLDPSLLPPVGQRFLRAYRGRFGLPANPAAAYGYEAMALLLGAIRRAGGDGDQRSAVTDQVLSTRDRHSVLGTYSIDGNGDTTLDAVSGYRIADGLPVFPVSLHAPR
jgi:branched-chain amino acid transport system substrate-binding protein